MTAIADNRSVAAPRQFDRAALWRVARRVAAVFGRENFSLIAAGCAFWGALSIAPMLAAVAAVYGLFADPAAIRAHLVMLRDVAPPEAFALVQSQAEALTGAEADALGAASIAAALVAVWTARSGVRALMDGVSAAYRQEEGRGFVKAQAATFLLTLTLVGVAVVALASVVVAPAILSLLPDWGLGATLAQVLRWPVALAAMAGGLSLLYRYAPARRPARWRWITPGSIAAVALWLIASAGFSLYVARFSDFNETYGGLGAVAALLMWLWISALSALLGAVLNAELEFETAADTTVGPDRPMGARGAFVADHAASDASA